MTHCSLTDCAEAISIPFGCRYCTHYYCNKHRLPENHACPAIAAQKERNLSKTKPIDAHFVLNPAKYSEIEKNVSNEGPLTRIRENLQLWLQRPGVAHARVSFLLKWLWVCLGVGFFLMVWFLLFLSK